ncbi:MAG: hypothetical protein KDD62_09550 [Bdellovibrionales bacterium]|nr:hypothetical protein [Bdellovibrionales bacterium]
MVLANRESEILDMASQATGPANGRQNEPAPTPETAEAAVSAQNPNPDTTPLRDSRLPTNPEGSAASTQANTAQELLLFAQSNISNFDQMAKNYAQQASERTAACDQLDEQFRNYQQTAKPQAFTKRLTKFFSQTIPQTLKNIDAKIVACLKKVIDIDSAVAPMRSEIFQSLHGKEISHTELKQLPKIIQHCAVPADKIGTLPSWNILKTHLEASMGKQVSSSTDLALSLSSPDGKHQMTLVHSRDGKVRIYYDGKKLGSAWNDDAVKICALFAAGRFDPERSVKRKVVENFVIGKATADDNELLRQQAA